jgi:hypothetical protein
MAKKKKKSTGLKKKKNLKRRIKKWISSTVIIGLIIPLLIFFLQYKDSEERWRKEKAYAYSEKSLQMVYQPIYQVLIYQKKLTVSEYIKAIERITQGNEIYFADLNDDFILLKEKHVSYQKIKSKKDISQKVKDKKKSELLGATLDFNTRFNERFQNIVKEYYSSKGMDVPGYRVIALVILVE